MMAMGLINVMGFDRPLCRKVFAIGMQRFSIDENNNCISIIYSKELKDILGVHSSSFHGRIDYICDRYIKERTLYDGYILLKDEYSGKNAGHQIIIDASYKNGVLKLWYNNCIADKLANISMMYKQLEINELCMLRSVYSIKLYEMIIKATCCNSMGKQCVHIPDKNESELILEYPLGILKLNLGITKVIEIQPLIDEIMQKQLDYEKIEKIINEHKLTKYKEYSEFDRRVLQKAVEEVNSKTSVLIKYEPIVNDGIKVGVRFFVNNTNV